MAVLVVGGSGRGAGKTAVGCALIQAMPELRWVAVKATSHGHADEIGSEAEAPFLFTDAMMAVNSGPSLMAEVSNRGFGLLEEAGQAGMGDLDKDTRRYLAAGARRAFLVSGAEGTGSQVVEARRLAPECNAMLVESNRIAAETIADGAERGICLAVLAGSAAGWKASLAECVGHADAVVLAAGVSVGGTGLCLAAKRVFSLAQGEWTTPELVAFVRGCLLP